MATKTLKGKFLPQYRTAAGRSAAGARRAWVTIGVPACGLPSRKRTPSGMQSR